MLQKTYYMRKTFNVSFLNKSNPESPFREKGAHIMTDLELLEWLNDAANKCKWDKITDIQVIEEKSSVNKNDMYRIDLIIPILRPLLHIFRPGEIAKPILFTPLPGKIEFPMLSAETLYPIKSMLWDGKNNPHLDIGLKSTLSYVTSYETGERLRDGDKIHWCHPIRFEWVEEKTNDTMQFIKEDSY